MSISPLSSISSISAQVFDSRHKYTWSWHTRRSSAGNHSRNLTSRPRNSFRDNHQSGKTHVHDLLPAADDVPPATGRQKQPMEKAAQREQGDKTLNRAAPIFPRAALDTVQTSHRLPFSVIPLSQKSFLFLHGVIAHIRVFDILRIFSSEKVLSL